MLLPLFHIAGLELTLVNILIIITLTLLAFAAGVLPGLGPVVSISLLIPYIRLFDRPVGLALLGSIYMAATYGGSITSILMNIPGTGASTATLLDGYPMSKKGEAITALSLSTTASALGGLISLVIVYFTIPYLINVVVLFGSPEYLVLIVFGLLIIALVSKGNMIKGLLAGALGLMVMSIGVSLQTGVVRYTFDIPYFYNGLQLLSVLLGVFAVTQTFTLAGTSSQIARSGLLEGSVIDGIRITLSRPIVLIRSSLVGFVAGLVPGAGGAIANFLAYGISQTRDYKDGDPEYGDGNPNGVISAESSNNANVSGALVPTLTFGIPGSATSAAILGAIAIVGLNPGPQLFTENLESVYVIYFGIFLAVLFILAMYLAAPYLSLVTLIDRAVLIPFILVVSTIGVYSVRSAYGDVIMMYVFGLIGYVLVRHNYVLIALILGVILGPQAETMLIRTIQLGGFSLVQTRPLFAVLLGLLVLTLISSILPISPKEILRRVVDRSIR